MICYNHENSKHLLINHIKNVMPGIADDIANNEELQTLLRRLDNEETDVFGDGREIMRQLYFRETNYLRSYILTIGSFAPHRMALISADHSDRR